MPIAPATKEEESNSRGDNVIPSSVRMPMGELTQEEQLAIALKAYVDMALEKRAVQVASFIHDRALGNLQVLYILFPFYCSALSVGVCFQARRLESSGFLTKQ